MDRVRLGRALGYGTRHAAKTVAAVVEAAAAPETRHRPPATAVRTSNASATAARTPSDIANAESGRPTPSLRPAPGGLGAGVRHFKRSFWQPLAVFSGALWLRVTGLFFALIAFTMLSGAWRLRPVWHGGLAVPTPHRFWAFAIFGTLFGYFAISSFVRASLRERRAISASR